VSPELTAVMICDPTALKDPVLGGMRRFRGKVGSKADGFPFIGTGRHHFPSIRGLKAPNCHEEGRRKLPDVTIHLGILATLAGLFAGLAVAVFNIRNTAFGLEPFLERVALAGDLEDIEGLPLVVLYVAFGALNCLAHHSEEEINHG
jgi:hypothetical protein